MSEAKAYLVTQGEYSDYRVRGVFTDKDKAEKMKSLLQYAEIEERPVNPELPDPPNAWRMWRLNINKEGNVSHVFESDSIDYDTMTLLRPEIEFCWDGRVATLDMKVWASDEEHAKKVAGEKLVQILAMGVWPEKAAESTMSGHKLCSDANALLKDKSDLGAES